MWSRGLLELQKRVGWEAHKYPARAWRADEYIHWLREDARGLAPAELWAQWQSSAVWGRDRAYEVNLGRLESVLFGSGRAALLKRAEAILTGEFQLFFRHPVTAGFPPDWLVNPAIGSSSRPGPNLHWSKVSMRGDGYRDLKFVWELSRFGWAFSLARAFALTADERYAEGFWFLWEHWLVANPPNATAQWKCGQECALRMIAVAFALQILAPARASTPERFVKTLGAVAVHADRIASAGWYARLQSNNHSMSEGVGVYTIGAWFPQLTKAGEWRDYGWHELENEALRLIRPDGTFVQKSHNYHRLMMHDYLWAMSVGDFAGDVFSSQVQERLRAATNYLTAVVDPVSGGCPNFGNNDGALILPLEEATYDDFRPVAAAAWQRLHGARLWSVPGPWDETLFWLHGSQDLGQVGDRQKKAEVQDFPVGGLYLTRQTESWTLLHAEHYRDRPAQADQLHLDLWWRGQNICRDPGTFLYYGEHADFAWFSGTAMHNTVTIDGLDQMEAGPRFLWTSRAQARVVARESGVGIIAEHDGYGRLPGPMLHRRGVMVLGEDAWLVWDEVMGLGEHELCLHWLLGDYPVEQLGDHGLKLDILEEDYFVWTGVHDGKVAEPSPLRLQRGESGLAARGWESRFYGEKQPAISATVRKLVNLSPGRLVRFVTVLAPTPPAYHRDEAGVGSLDCGGRVLRFPESASWRFSSFSFPN